MAKIPSWKPKCPICAETLDGVPWPLPAKGKGRCPNAGMYSFEAEVDESKVVKDKDGNETKSAGWKITGGSKH